MFEADQAATSQRLTPWWCCSLQVVLPARGSAPAVANSALLELGRRPPTVAAPAPTAHLAQHQLLAPLFVMVSPLPPTLLVLVQADQCQTVLFIYRTLSCCQKRAAAYSTPAACNPAPRIPLLQRQGAALKPCPCQ
jgi:hypothetical protein